MGVVLDRELSWQLLGYAVPNQPLLRICFRPCGQVADQIYSQYPLRARVGVLVWRDDSCCLGYRRFAPIRLRQRSLAVGTRVICYNANQDVIAG